MVFRLKITLLGSKPPIWRRVRVPSTIRLAGLHRVIQAVMPWSDIHFHHFERAGVCYGRQDPEHAGAVLLDEAEMPLAAMLRQPRDWLDYTYDFADEWKHRIVLEASDADPAIRRPQCIAGRRACPPEEIGGLTGYEDALAILAQPGHPDCAETRVRLARESMHGTWDAEYFDPAEADAALAHASGEEQREELASGV